MQFLVWHCFFPLHFYGLELVVQMAELTPLGSFIRPLEGLLVSRLTPGTRLCLCACFWVDNELVLRSPFRELNKWFS